MPAQDSCLTLNRQKLLDEINRRHLKRELLAEEIGVTPRTLRRWLHGQTSRVQLIHLDQLAQKLGCALTDLVADHEAVQTPYQSPDIHPVLRQLRKFVLQGATPENFECATQLVHGCGGELPFDTQAAALYEYARFAFQLGHTAIAQRSFERAVMKADAAGVDSIRFQSFLSLAQLCSFQGDDGRERESLFLEQAEHVLIRLRSPHWRPFLWLMEARHAVSRGQLEKALTLGENALAIIRQDPSPPTLDTIESLGIMANIYHAVGSRRKAHEILLYAESLAGSLLHPEHPMRGRILITQASINGFLGNGSLSQRQAEEAVRILEAVLPLENFEMTAALVHRGAILCDEGHYEQGIAIMQKALGGHPDHEAGLRTNLGLFLHRMGRHEAAVAEGKKAVELHIEKFGPEHPQTAAAMGRYAGPMQSLGQVETAEKMYREAARLLHQADPFHVRILDQVRNQATCLLAMNRADEAAQILKEHRKIYTKRDESPSYQGRYSLLQAQALAQSQKKQEALPLALEARTRFQSPGVDPVLRHEAEALIRSIQRPT